MTEPLEDWHAALAERYRVERELGRGAMATVYLAHDLKHDRPVAVKVLHPGLANALGPERFQREIKLAARLQHPHILTVLDSGETAGQLWFTMPFVEGESLRDRLNREKQLPVADAVRIAREAAQGLDYAHRHGVVHRDIKPENLLLTEDGNTLVADFGIARSLSAGGENLTRTGTSLGTAAYMSPEQAAGEPDVDARTDVYALGIVLYEMLAGETPFAAPTPQATIARRFTDTPRPLRELRDTVPEHVERAVQTALARTPADRFATARAFADSLRPANIAAGQPITADATTTAAAPSATRHPRRLPAAFLTMVLGLVIGFGLLFAWRGHSHSDAAAGGPPTIAVLPFENLGDSADAYFASGMTDAVRGNLTGLAGLRVIARASSEHYRGSAETPTEIARELGARYLLTGTVRWAKSSDGTSRVQVSPELVEVTGDGAASSKWQQRFDAPLTDVFKVQGDIAAEVADAMRVALSGAERSRIAAALTAVPAAYDVYLRGEAAWSGGDLRTPAAIRRAIDFYEQAVSLDSTFAAAWGEIGYASATLYVNSTPTPALARQAKAAADRASALDPDGVPGHRALATYYCLVMADNERALSEAEAAYRLAPSDASVIDDLVLTLRSTGRWDEALRYARAAYAIDPRTAGRPGSLAWVYLWLRRPAEARPFADRSLALAPRGARWIQTRAMVSLSEGDLPGARRILKGTTYVSAEELAAYAANYWDLGWVLDDAGQRLALSLGSEAYDNNRAALGIIRAQLYGWRGDAALSRVWADTAERYFAAQLRAVPDDAQLHVFHGLALAYAGHYGEAIAEGERGVKLGPVSSDAETGPYYLHVLVRIYLLAGRYDEALDRLEKLMKIPYFVSPAWLRIDPAFTPLKGNPRFERLARGAV